MAADHDESLITSVQNPKVKAAAALRDRKAREETGQFIVEGWREIERALRSGYIPNAVFYDRDHLHPEAARFLQSVGPSTALYAVAERVLARLLVREQSDGLAMIFNIKRLPLEELELPPSPLVVVAESLEKPGNLGALLRSIDGAGAAALILVDPKVDQFHPQVLRNSLGTAFAVPVVTASFADAINFLRLHKIQIVAASPEADQPYTKVNFRNATALVLGSEADGLSARWSGVIDQRVAIPMLGVADSLNISISGSVIIYEALRQRQSGEAPK